MKRLITLDDFIETYTKLHQRGLGFISSKFRLSDLERAKTAFNHLNIESANCWIIPSVVKRWNYLLSGGKDLSTEQFVFTQFIKGKQNLKVLSLGSGSCRSELILAEHQNIEEMLCIDIAEKPLHEAKKRAEIRKLNNIKFKAQDINNYFFTENYFDIIYMKSSLHHFKGVDNLIGNLITKALKKNGVLIINEYVGPNRLQFPRHQIKAINEAIQLIPKKYRKRYKVNLNKNRVYGAGWIRMILADPSECIDSESIKPALKKYYNKVYEAGYGGNILTLCLKDLAHHFVELNEEKEDILNKLFEFEDNYLKKYPSDFIFGVYTPKMQH